MNKQQGAALVVVLSMLTMSLMLGLSGMQSSLVEERLSGNYKAATEAQMAAEKAATQGWADTEEEGQFESYSISDVESMSWEEFVGNGSFEKPISDNYCEGGLECYFRLIGDGGGNYIIALGGVFDGENLLAKSQYVIVEVMLPGGGSVFSGNGMLAGVNINIKGSSVFDGSLHANEVLDIKGSYVQRNDDATMTDGFEVEIPEIDFSPYMSGGYEIVELEVESGKGSDPDSCEFSYSGDLDGRVFYCSGDIEMASSGSFSNAILLSEGGVTQNGSIQAGEEGIDVAVLAKGDIRFNGASTVYGWFLAGGDVRQNGSSVLNGSIVAHGTIRRNGGMTFKHEPDGSVNLPPGEDEEKSIISWR
ncbi:MAG: pilus assembly PilX family protein [Pseudomonadota bacterium]